MAFEQLKLIKMLYKLLLLLLLLLLLVVVVVVVVVYYVSPSDHPTRQNQGHMSLWEVAPKLNNHSQDQSHARL